MLVNQQSLNQFGERILTSSAALHTITLSLFTFPSQWYGYIHVPYSCEEGCSLDGSVYCATPQVVLGTLAVDEPIGRV